MRCPCSSCSAAGQRCWQSSPRVLASVGSAASPRPDGRTGRQAEVSAPTPSQGVQEDLFLLSSVLLHFFVSSFLSCCTSPIFHTVAFSSARTHASLEMYTDLLTQNFSFFVSALLTCSGFASYSLERVRDGAAVAAAPSPQTLRQNLSKFSSLFH